MTQLTEESEYIPINNVFIFARNANKFITHTPFSLERIVEKLIGYQYWKPNLGVVLMFRMRTMTQIWEMMSFKLES
jgi:hypothetical protein